MPSEASLPLSTIFGFLLALARIAGVVTFIPIPGATGAPAPARLVLAMGITFAMAPFWPVVSGEPGVAQLTAWLLGEAALGITIGLLVGFLTEAFLMLGQVAALQAGFSYASTVDPNTQADSGVLMVVAQTAASLLFFALGLHRETLRALAGSLQTLPPGAFRATVPLAETVIRLSSTIFSTGFRLALPVVALLLMADLAMALLGRINSQLQLLILSFPVKTLAALALLAAITTAFPHVYSGYAEQIFEQVYEIVGGRR